MPASTRRRSTWRAALQPTTRPIRKSPTLPRSRRRAWARSARRKRGWPESIAIRSAPARSPSKCGAWPDGSPRIAMPHSRTGQAQPRTISRARPSPTMSTPMRWAAAPIPPSTPPRWRCSRATRRGHPVWRTGHWRRRGPAATTGITLPPAKLCLFSDARRKPVFTTQKPIAWLGTGSAMSPPCGGSCC